jgi:hypothetical protein
MNNLDLNKIMEWLGVMLKCPICSAKYLVEQTKVISSEQFRPFNEARILIHSDCSKCKSSVMFNVEIHGPQVYSVGMVTDLTSADSMKFKDLTKITADELIDLHLSLKKFEGDFLTTLTAKN